MPVPSLVRALVRLGVLALVALSPSAFAAPSGTVDVTGPASMVAQGTYNLGVAYSLTGTGVTNARVTVTLPAGVYISSAVGPQGVTSSCTNNWTTPDHVCTFNLTFSSGGVAGQLTIAATLYPTYQIDGAQMTATATLTANYDNAGSVVPMQPVSDTLNTAFQANADLYAHTSALLNPDWRVNPNPPAGKSAVGLSWEYRVNARSNNAALNAGWTLRVAVPDPAVFVSWQDENISANPVTAPTPWTTGDVVFTGVSMLRYWDSTARVRVWVSCTDLPLVAGALVNTLTLDGTEPKASGAVARTYVSTFNQVPGIGTTGCGSGGGGGKSSNPQFTVGADENFTWTVTGTPPNGVVSVTDAVVIDRIPAGVVFVSANPATPTGFTPWYCVLPAVAGNFTRAQFLSTYRNAGCSAAAPADVSTVTHIVWYAPTWGDPATGISAFSGTLTTRVPEGALAHGTVVTNAARVSGGYDLGTPSTFDFMPTDTIEVMTQGQVEIFPWFLPTNSIVPRRPGEPFDIVLTVGSRWGGMRVRNPTAVITLPPEVEYLAPGPIYFSGNGCPWGSAQPTTWTQAPAAVTLPDGRTQLTWSFGSAAQPTRMGFDCNYGGAGWLLNKPLWVQATVRVRPDAAVINGQTLTYIGSAAGDNAPAHPGYPASLTVARPAEMRTDVQPDCSDNLPPEPSLLVTYQNTGGEALTNLFVSARIPKVGDGSGTQVNTTFVRLENLPAGVVPEYEVGGSWTGTVPGNLSLVTAVRVRHTAALAPLTPLLAFNVVLSVPAGTPTGTFIRGSSFMSASPLGNLASANSAPIKVNLCPGLLQVHAFFDADADGQPDAGEQDLAGWTVEVVDLADPQTELVWTTDSEGAYEQQLSPGDYALTLVSPVPGANATWSEAVATATVASNQTTLVLLPIRCTCAVTGACLDGTCSPTGTCTYAPAGPRSGVVDACGGGDDDCDGTTDEDFVATETSCGTGACQRAGATQCIGGVVRTECIPGLPTTEICDGLDNDCDSLTDANDPTLDRPLCEKQDGVCGGSVKSPSMCVATELGASWAPCRDADYAAWAFAESEDSAGQSGTYALAEAIACDGLDNDCDGATDEGYLPDEVSCGFGACQRTVSTTCVGGVEQDTCTPDAAKASAETCDGLDNDCDGATDGLDSSLTLAPCDEQRGVCGGAVHTAGQCVQGRWTVCGATEYGPHFATSDVTCDGKDNDCDGGIDEQHAAATTVCGVGACAGTTGQLVCRSGGVLEDTCEPLARASEERCNERDDDCDGTTDETFSLGGACSVGTGLCARTGVAVCAPGGTMTTCSVTPGSPSPERCDGRDENCDGVADDAYFSLGTVCTVGVGACSATGAKLCLGDGSVGCSAAPGNGTAESCDGVDNDCDGQVDEDGQGGSVCLEVETEILACPDSPTSLTAWRFQFEETAADGQAFECKLDSAAWTRCDGGSFAVEALGEGSHTLLVRALGVQGRFDTTPAFCVWVVDTKAPDTYILAAPEDPSQTGDGTLVFGSNVQNPQGYFCLVAPGSAPAEPPPLAAYAPCEVVETVNGLPDGLHTVHVYVVSESGVRDESPAVYTWLIDSTAPATLIDLRPDPVVCGSTVTIGFRDPSNDATMTFDCRLDEEPWESCSAPSVTYEGLSPGNHVVDIRAVDAAGLADPTPARAAFTVDVTPPVTTVALGPDSPSQNPNAAFAFASDDPDTSFQCAVTPAGEVPSEDALRGCASPFSVTGLADGAWTFHVRALGRWCGQGEIATWRWLIDTTYPETAFLTTPEVLVGVDEETTFTFNDPTDEAVTTFECSLDEADWTACDGGSLALDALPLGPHQLTVRTCIEVRDGDASVRRCDPTPATTAWSVSPSTCPLDREPPTLVCPEPTTLTCLDGGATFDASTLVIAASDACGAVTAYEGAIGGLYPLGLSPVVVSASDDNGNIATCAALVEVVDSEPPSITCPEAVTVATEPGTCGVRVDLAAPVVLDACAGGDVNVRNNAPPVFAPGETVVTFSALDPSGREASCTTTVTVTDDESLKLTCEPELTQVAPPDACGWTGVLTAEASDNCALDVTIVEERNTFAVGTQQVTFNAQDDDGESATCVTTLIVRDETPPTVACGLEAFTSAPSGPVAVRASADDACGATVTLEGLACAVRGLDGVERPLAPELCPVRVGGDTLEVATMAPDGALVLNWTARAVDPSGNVATTPCALVFASDIDGDGLLDGADNCPLARNADQADMDGDAAGDACDANLDGIVATGSGCAGGGESGLFAGLLGLLAMARLVRRGGRA